MLKAVIMDFDGLIVDTEVVWYNIFREWFKKKQNYDLPVEEFLFCVGSNAEDLFNTLEIKNNCIIDRDEFAKDTQKIFLERSEILPPKEGVVEFIKSVKSEGLKLSLATSSKRIKPTKHLERLGLIKYFDSIVTAEDVARIKPHPDLFLKAVEKLGINKNEALIVEDSLNGLNSGLNAEMRVLVIPNDVTKYCNFRNYYKIADSLLNIDVKKLISDF